MRLTDEQFYNETLDLTKPELKNACDLYNHGQKQAAEKAFAEFIKKDLKPQLWLTREIKIGEGTHGYSEVEFADMVVEGYVNSVGFLYQYPEGKVDWAYNPTFNNYGEFTYHLCAHGSIQALAKAYLQSPKEAYAKRFMYLVSSWIDQAECPEPGSNGTPPLYRTIEAGGRMRYSWPDAIHVFLHSETVTDAFWVKMFKAIWEHSYRLLHSTTIYNWHTGELAGLATMGVLYHCFKDGELWLDYALKGLVHQIDTEFYPDGMQAELATGYQRAVIGTFNSVADLLTLYGKEVPKDFRSGVELIYTMFPKLVNPRGECPGLNDAATFPIKQTMEEASRRYPENEVFRFFATEGREGQEPEYRTSILPYSGFVVMRTDWSKDAMWALFDCGPEGAQHIHEDKLTVSIYAYGTEMLSDIGFYAYDTSDMRKYVISSHSHNTGLVDGQGQNRIKTHQWGLVDTKLVQDFFYEYSEELEVAAASYSEGYGEEVIQAKHSRKLFFVKKGLGGSGPFFVLYDEFISEDGQEHDFEINFQLPEVPVQILGHSVTASYSTGATLKMVSDKYPKVYVGQYVPQFRGWQPIHGPKEHEHAPAPAVTYTKRGLSARFATVLYPASDEKASDIAVMLTDTGAKLRFGQDSLEIK